MIKTSKLKERIQQSEFAISDISKLLGMHVSTFYRKLERGDKSFTIEEAKKISELLNLSYSEMNDIFFDFGVA